MFSVKLNFEKNNSLLWMFETPLVDHQKMEKICPWLLFFFSGAGMKRRKLW
jgi:hypothetical protein